MATRLKYIVLALLYATCIEGQDQLHHIHHALSAASRRFDLPPLQLAYEDNLEEIKQPASVKMQTQFFDSLSAAFLALEERQFSAKDPLIYHQTAFELKLHRTRVRLEAAWNAQGRPVPAGGFYALENGKEWYTYFLQRFTGLDITPEQVMQAGKDEVASALKDLAAATADIQLAGPQELCERLSRSDQYLYHKDTIRRHFLHADSIVRSNLSLLFHHTDLPAIEPIEWQGADGNTPPGIYLSRNSNAYGTDVFMYNFFGGKFPRRCLDWLYLHEAIPGHHLQSQYFSADGPVYFGSSEGWACYVENLGATLGLYRNIYSRIGEMQWNLVRSARLVLDVGIHYYGWDRRKALAYWKEKIACQDEIAEREISRVTAWPAQAVCYKTGALAIRDLIEVWKSQGMDIKDAHAQVLRESDRPLACWSHQLH